MIGEGVVAICRKQPQRNIAAIIFWRDGLLQFLAERAVEVRLQQLPHFGNLPLGYAMPTDEGKADGGKRSFQGLLDHLIAGL